MDVRQATLSRKSIFSAVTASAAVVLTAGLVLLLTPATTSGQNPDAYTLKRIQHQNKFNGAAGKKCDVGSTDHATCGKDGEPGWNGHRDYYEVTWDAATDGTGFCPAGQNMRVTDETTAYFYFPLEKNGVAVFTEESIDVITEFPQGLNVSRPVCMSLTVTASPNPVSEGSTVTFTMNTSNLSRTSSVQWATSAPGVEGWAESPADFTAKSDTWSFTPTNDERMVYVYIKNDTSVWNGL